MKVQWFVRFCDQRVSGFWLLYNTDEVNLYLSKINAFVILVFYKVSIFLVITGKIDEGN